jgi:hypothetical protein
MRVILLFIVAIGLIWVGVLESATSSVKDFKQHSNGEALENQRSIRRVFAVGLVGDLVVKKIISDGRHTIIIKGNEKFLTPDEVSSDHADS